MLESPGAKIGEAHVAACESFYSLVEDAFDGKACQGLACYVARHLNPGRWEHAGSQSGKLYCLGKCYAGPARGADTSRPHVEVCAREAVVLRNDPAGAAWEKARRMSPDEILRAVEASNLRGRGGAGFPAGRKWRAVARQTATPRYVVVNADEGDPGAFIDRFIIEDNSPRLIEAITIAGRAVGAAKGYIYLRKEYPRAEQLLRRALAETNFGFDIELVMGLGSYVCGEETALLNSIEGRRPEVRQRPPYPTEKGLWDQPTLVNNVETLVSIPWIIEHGADAYRALGFSKSQGTKVLSLNSLFHRPGLYEVEFGVTVRHIIEELGGGLKTGALKGVIIGGPLAGIVPPTLLDTLFGFEELRAIGAMVGHGGIIAFDEHTSICDLVQHVIEFAAVESCGKCTPCRRGSQRLLQLPDQLETNEIVAALLSTSLCGLGTGLGEFLASALKYYQEDLTTCFA